MKQKSKICVVHYSSVQAARLARHAIRLERERQNKAEQKKQNIINREKKRRWRARMSGQRNPGKGHIKAANYDHASPGGHGISGGLPSLGKR
jgi:hypothetical protein